MALSIKARGGLEEFLRDYLNERELTSGPDSFTKYKRERYEDYDAAYESAMREALGAARVSKFGPEAEALRSRGISGGYLTHLERLREEGLERSTSEITATRDEAAARAARGYLGYLNGYQRNQENIRGALVRRLTADGVYKAQTIYAQAIAAGLNPKMATAAVGEVQSATRERIKADLFSRIVSKKITPEGAAAEAEAYGLPKEDIDYLLTEGQRYVTKYVEYAEELIKELEKKGSKSTSSYNLPT